jgi:polyferredoxin
MKADAVETVVGSIPQKTKKILVRRNRSDRSQQVRHAVQWLFVALNAWIGTQFYFWVRFYERGGVGLNPPRPAGVEGWLPIAGLMNSKYLFTTGRVPAVHPAAMYLFLGFLLISVLLKKAFCSWLCPVGTLSENLWKFGQRIFKRTFRLPSWLDVPLRVIKYLLLAFFAWIIGRMSAEALEGFMGSPYGIVADVKMLNFFRDMGLMAAIVIGVLVVLSIFVRNFWCRYWCPYGALLGIASILSPVKIRRDEEACIDCGKCAKACPSNLKVDELMQIRSVECNACMACVAACSAQDALQFALPARRQAIRQQRWYRRALSPFAVTAVVAYIFFGAVLIARATGHWQSNIPQDMYINLVPYADQVTHMEF